MPYTDKFRRQHDDILAVVAELKSQLQPEALRRDPRAARTLLSSLAGKLSVHLAMEDRSLYPRLQQSGDEVTRKLAGAFMTEMGGLGAVFAAYNQKWQVGAIEADPTTFARESAQVFGALGKRIERENRQLYPLADQSFQPVAIDA